MFCAYKVSKDRNKMNYFYETADIDNKAKEAITSIVNNNFEGVRIFCRYFEALVAYYSYEQEMKKGGNN
jgi:hypothetical protein